MISVFVLANALRVDVTQLIRLNQSSGHQQRLLADLLMTSYYHSYPRQWGRARRIKATAPQTWSCTTLHETSQYDTPEVGNIPFCTPMKQDLSSTHFF